MSWCVYLLREVGGTRTYVGATLDVDRRLSQHNGVLVGGARATRGRAWNRICHVRGFPHQKAALQFEWAWKYFTKAQDGSNTMKRRVQALCVMLGLDQPTSKANDYLTYVGALDVVWEDLSDPCVYM